MTLVERLQAPILPADNSLKAHKMALHDSKHLGRLAADRIVELETALDCARIALEGMEFDVQGEASVAFAECLEALGDEPTGTCVVCEGRTTVTVTRIAEFNSRGEVHVQDLESD